MLQKSTLNPWNLLKKTRPSWLTCEKNLWTCSPWFNCVFSGTSSTCSILSPTNPAKKATPSTHLPIPSSDLGCWLGEPNFRHSQCGDFQLIAGATLSNSAPHLHPFDLQVPSANSTITHQSTLIQPLPSPPKRHLAFSPKWHTKRGWRCVSHVDDEVLIFNPTLSNQWTQRLLKGEVWPRGFAYHKKFYQHKIWLGFLKCVCSLKLTCFVWINSLLSKEI